jgi:hypothetical protein
MTDGASGRNEGGDNPAPKEAEHSEVKVEPPESPESLPAYVVDPLRKQSISRLHEVTAFVEALIEYKSELQHEVTELDELRESEAVTDVAESDGKGVIVERKVKCGTETCQCMTGDEEKMHGPYKYRYFRDENGDLVTEYIAPV